MTMEELRRTVWRNAASNYVCLGLRLVVGLIMFRMLYRAMTREEFGFWTLLWSVFGYGVLLDFGFGFTAQKRVAELSFHEDWPQLSQVLSTVFFTYLGVAAAIAVLGAFGSPLFIDMIQITTENRERFRVVMAVFLCGIGLAFPLGLFPEILRGQQRIALANSIYAVGLLANTVLVALAVKQHWGLLPLVLIAVLCTIIPDLVCGIFAMRRLPQVQIRFRFFSRKMVRQTMSFSLFAYVSIVSNVVLGKTDQLVISSAIAVSAVALYQAAAKIAEMFSSLSLQLPETFSPLAAHLHAKGDKAVIRQLLVTGSRFTVMIATPAYLVCAFYMNALLKLLTGEAVPMTFWVGQVLLLWSYMTVVTQSVSKRVFMMCGHERRLMFLGLGEALLNLGLSVALVLYYKTVICVALGSLISTVIFGWGVLWPWAARETQISGWKLTRMILGPAWLACLPLLVMMTLARTAPFLDLGDNLWLLLLQSGVAAVVAIASVWRLGLTQTERARFRLLLTGLLFKKAAPA